MNYIGVDIGSSFIKAAILDTGSRQIIDVRKQQTPERLPNPDRNIYEVNVLSIVRSLTTMIDEYAGKYGPIVGILLSTQMHGFVLCDESGEPLTNYISWQDTRGTTPYGNATISSFEHISAVISSEQMERSGTQLKPGLAACNLHHWMMNHRHVIEKDNIYFCTLGSFVIYKLTGRHTCHITNAAPTGFADVERRAWNWETIRAVGCESLVFPDILDEQEICGYYDSAGGGIPVYPDIGDHQASVLGALGGDNDAAIVSGGTAGIVSLVSNKATRGDHENRPYFGGQTLKTITRLPGGRNLDVLVDFIADIGISLFEASRSRAEIWQAISQAVDRLDPSRPLEAPRVELGFFQGQQGVQHGKIDGIRPGNLTAGSLFAAAFENMADVYISALRKLMDPTAPIAKIWLTGGTIHNNVFMRTIMQARTGIETIPSPVQNEELRGLLHLALRISGT
ncbi:sedoheptulokinase [Paenibacillus hodogayensis]|uniref:Sedoheptulokinase n=1 Tax=Paenibacillus hodogayensis TaxID=279208 RepID=A0ABV5VQV8_9BACL